jgi:hypothetical protein
MKRGEKRSQLVALQPLWDQVVEAILKQVLLDIMIFTRDYGNGLIAYFIHQTMFVIDAP